MYFLVTEIFTLAHGIFIFVFFVGFVSLQTLIYHSKRWAKAPQGIRLLWYLQQKH